MAREIMVVDCVSAEVKRQLKEAALKQYGQANASLLVRELITSYLVKPAQKRIRLTAEEASDTVELKLRLPSVAVAQFTELAESRFSRRNYYVASILLSHLGQVQLQGDEIEVLRHSNYELSRIGTNLNQIAKAFNILVKVGEGGKAPEIGKKIASLRKEITDHTSKVLRVLHAGTTVWENTGRGSGLKRKKPVRTKGNIK